MLFHPVACYGDLLRRACIKALILSPNTTRSKALISYTYTVRVGSTSNFCGDYPRLAFLTFCVPCSVGENALRLAFSTISLLPNLLRLSFSHAFRGAVGGVRCLRYGRSLVRMPL